MSDISSSPFPVLRAHRRLSRPPSSVRSWEPSARPLSLVSKCPRDPPTTAAAIFLVAQDATDAVCRECVCLCLAAYHPEVINSGLLQEQRTSSNVCSLSVGFLRIDPLKKGLQMYDYSIVVTVHIVIVIVVCQILWLDHIYRKKKTNNTYNTELVPLNLILNKF